MKNRNDMAEAETNGRETVSLTTKWGGLSLGGKNAIDIFLFIAIVGLTIFVGWEHIERSKEHDSINCQLRLSIFMQSQAVDKPINWRLMPVDLFGCVPKFLYDRDINVR